QLANLVAIDELRVYSEALLKLHDVLDGGPVLFPSEDHVSYLLEPARISELFIEALEHLDSPFREPDRDLVRIVLAHIGRRVPRGSGGEQVFFEQHHLAKAQLGQEVSGARAHNAATNHDRV